MLAYRGIGARGADGDSIREHFDLPKLRNIPNVDQISAEQLSTTVRNQRVGPAGNGQPLRWLASQQGKNSLQIAGRNKSVFGWIGSHVATIRRAALATALKICV